MRIACGVMRIACGVMRIACGGAESPFPTCGGRGWGWGRQPNTGANTRAMNKRNTHTKQPQDRRHIPEAMRATMLDVARQFRKEPIASEARLWQALRGKQLGGRKWRRQQPIGPFVVDFYCARERLIVEVDGAIHLTQRRADEQRQDLLESLGLRFLRVSAQAVETELPAVLAAIHNMYSNE